MSSPLIIFRRSFWVIILSLILLLYPLPSLALTVQEVPNPQQEYGAWVIDMAEILSPKTEAQLNQMISELEAKNGSEITVVTVPEVRPAPNTKDFATKLFNYWKIGKKEQNNSVLFFVSPSDRGVEIKTSKGVQNILPNYKVKNLLETKVLPKFKLGLLETGIVAGTTELVSSVETGEYKLVPIPDDYYSMDGFIIGINIIMTILVFFLLLNIKSNTTDKNTSSSSDSSYFGIGSSSSGSHDSGSFGGGGSDGGGGGGDW